jgi:hypothetical protein
MSASATRTGASWRSAPLLRDRRAHIAVVYGGLVVIGLLVAYWSVFGFFADYDDEGTLLTTLKPFVAGHTLYGDIYTPYGPFYYEVWGGLFALSGRNVSTDASRMIVVGVWTLTSLCFALAVHRLSGRLVLGAAAMATAFAILNALIAEPMHPVGLIILLLGALALALTLGRTRRPTAAGAVAGSLLGALLLTKVNVGGFAIAGCAVAAVLTVPALRSRAWVRWPVVLAYVGLGMVLLSGDFEKESVRDFAFLVAASAAALVIAGLSGIAPRAEDGESRALAQRVLGMAIGLVGGVVVILGVIMVNGTSLADLWDNTVAEALRQHDIFALELKLPQAAAEWGLAAVGAAALAVRLGSERAAATPWPGVARVVVGLAIWACTARLGPFGLNPADVPVIALPLTLAWVAALKPAGLIEPGAMRFARLALPAVAVAETLQAYPVAGTQVSAAAVTFVPVGGLCLSDGWRSLQAWAGTRDPLTTTRVSATLGVAAVAVACMLTYTGVVRPGVRAAVAYHDQKALSFVGATRLRIPTDQRDTYEALVRLIRGNNCTALVGLPSTNSLYLWSFIDPPLPTLPSVWMTQLSAARQQRALDQIRRSPRPCGVRNNDLLSRWMQGRPIPQRPLYRYVEREFEPKAQVGNYTFLLPKASGSR